MASLSQKSYDIGQVIFETTDDYILIFNTKFECEYTNMQINLNNLTLSHDNKEIHKIIFLDDLVKLINLVKQTFKLGYARSEIRIIYKREDFKQYEIKGKRFVDNKKEKKVIVFLKDISLYKKFELEFKDRQNKLKELIDILPEIRYWKFLQSKGKKEAFQKAREMLELVIDNIPQYIYWKDINLNYLGCNKNFASIAGVYEPINIIGKRDKDLNWLKNKSIQIEECEKRLMLSNIAEYHKIENLILHSGDQIWFDVNRIPLHNLDGKVVGILSTYEDITDRKIADQKLKRSEEKYRGILENIKETYFEVDLNGTFTFFNDAMCNLMGYSREELLGKNYEELVNEENRNKIIEIYRNVYETGFPKSDFQYLFLNKEGEEVICESSVYIRYDPEGNKIGFSGVARDITEKFGLEQKIKESEKQYRHLFESSPYAIWLMETDGTIIDCNPVVNNLFSVLKRDDIIGKKFSVVISVLKRSDYLINVIKERFQIFLKGERLGPLEFQITRLDGKKVWLDIRSSLVKIGDRTLVQAIIQDITIRKNAEESLRKSEEELKVLNRELEQKVLERTRELRQSEKKLREQNIELKKLDKIKNDFITMAAHELKTPIISIAGYTDYILIKYRNILNLEIIEDLKIVKRNIKRLEALMDQLLEVMKIDEGKLKLQIEKINVSQIINNCLDELSYLINEKNLEIMLNIDREINLEIDPTRIFLVFTNLISNAIKYTPNYGWIEISAKKQQNKYIFKVKDNGVGLNENEIELLFKKFGRIEHPIEGNGVYIKNSGTGLGLYICKGIVKAHGGEIWAYSDGKSKGTTFEFTLPL